MAILVYVCGHATSESDLDIDQQSPELRFVRDVCDDGHCRSNGVLYYYEHNRGEGRIIRSILERMRRTVHRLFSDTRTHLSMVGVLPNRLTHADFPNPADAELAALLLGAYNNNDIALRAFLPALVWAAEVVLVAAFAILQQRGPDGWLDWIEQAVEIVVKSSLERCDYAVGRLRQIARWQENGLWELVSYDRQQGVAELGMLHSAGEVGARLLSAPISELNIRIVETMMNSLQHIIAEEGFGASHGAIAENPQQRPEPRSMVLHDNRQQSSRSRMRGIAAAHGIQSLDMARIHQRFG